MAWVAAALCRPAVVHKIALLTLLACNSNILCRALTGISGWQQGIATNYGGAQDGDSPYSPSFGTLDGSCGYGQLDPWEYPYWSVAALSPSNTFYQAGPLNGCGQCFQIMCTGGGCDNGTNSVVVMISDECPGCEADHIDMQALTFNKLAPMAVGRIQIQYRRVACAPPADMKVQVSDFTSNDGWIRLMVKQVGGRASISEVQLKGPTSDWEALNNIWGAMWELPQTPQLPLDLRIMCDDGEEVTAFSVIKATGPSNELPTDVQFSLVGGGISSSPSSNTQGSFSTSAPVSISPTSPSSASALQSPPPPPSSWSASSRPPPPAPSSGSAPQSPPPPLPPPPSGSSSGDKVQAFQGPPSG